MINSLHAEYDLKELHDQSSPHDMVLEKGRINFIKFDRIWKFYIKNHVFWIHINIYFEFCTSSDFFYIIKLPFLRTVTFCGFTVKIINMYIFHH